MKGYYLMQGDQFRYELANILMIKNDQYYLVVTRAIEKIIIENAQSGSAQYSFAMIDSFARLKGVMIAPLKFQGDFKGVQDYRLTRRRYKCRALV